MSFIAISKKRQPPVWAQLTRLAFASALAALPLMAQAEQPGSTEAQLQQLRQQIEEMRQYYEARLQLLENKVQQAYTMPATPQAALISAPEQPAPPMARSRDNSFNPAVSLVLSGTYARLSQDPDTWRLAGFTAVGEEAGPGARGLNLGESEVTFSASVDPWWYGAMTLAVTPENETELEEAFVQTTALSDGLTFKAGRFFSGVGYQNEQHAHAWDFIGAPLAYDAFLDGQLGHDGAQLTWLAPLDHYLLLGAELGKGTSTGHQAGARAVFARLGGDVGPASSWRLGVAHLWQQAHRTWDDTDLSGNEVSNGFVGKSRTWAIDGVWKWSPNGNAKRTAFKLQGEYFRRAERGQVGYDVDAESDDVLGSAAAVDAYRSAQSGWHVQGVYQFMPAWRVGLRHDQLDTGSVDYGSNNAAIARVNAQPQRNSLMLDWLPSEFSRWRLQMNQDKARQGVNDTQVYLQYQMNLGAHGAHGF